MGLFIHKNTRCRVYTGEGKSGFPGGPKVGPGKGMGSSHSYSKIASAGGNPYICHYKQLILMLRVPNVKVTGRVWGIYSQRDEGHKQKQTHKENFRISQSRGFTLMCLTQSSSNP